jgi:hypothetical protein
MRFYPDISNFGRSIVATERISEFDAAPENGRHPGQSMLSLMGRGGNRQTTKVRMLAYAPRATRGPQNNGHVVMLLRCFRGVLDTLRVWPHTSYGVNCRCNCQQPLLQRISRDTESIMYTSALPKEINVAYQGARE